MKTTPPAVKAYLAALPPDRLAAISTVREVIHKNLDPKLEEGVQYGMISYYVPHSVFPAGYHCDPKQPLLYAALASQKGYLSLYLMGVYMEEAERAWLEEQFRRAGKKLDAGKSCIRFKRVEDLPLGVIGEAFRRVPADRYLARYLANLGSRGKGGKKAAEKAAAATAATAEATKPAKPAAKAAKPAAKKPAAKAAKPARKAAARAR